MSEMNIAVAETMNRFSLCFRRCVFLVKDLWFYGHDSRVGSVALGCTRRVKTHSNDILLCRCACVKLVYNGRPICIGLVDIVKPRFKCLGISRTNLNENRFVPMGVAQKSSLLSKAAHILMAGKTVFVAAFQGAFLSNGLLSF